MIFVLSTCGRVQDLKLFVLQHIFMALSLYLDAYVSNIALLTKDDSLRVNKHIFLLRLNHHCDLGSIIYNWILRFDGIELSDSCLSHNNLLLGKDEMTFVKILMYNFLLCIKRFFVNEVGVSFHI